VTWQVPVPEHAPLHPANTEPIAGVGVSVTTIPLSNLALHVIPQLIPLGVDVTVPLPVPAPATDKVCGGGGLPSRQLPSVDVASKHTTRERGHERRNRLVAITGLKFPVAVSG
jgi:hypothetical protein